MSNRHLVVVALLQFILLILPLTSTSAGFEESTNNEPNNSALSNSIFSAIHAKNYDSLLSLLTSTTDLDLNTIRYDGYTPLTYACMLFDIHSVSLLLSRKPDPNLEDDHNRSPIYYSVGFLELEHLLLQNGASPEGGSGLTELHWTAWQDDDELFLSLFQDAEQAQDQNNTYKYSPLHLACFRGSTASAIIVMKLIESGANINARDIAGETPLNIAACYMHPLVVRILLEQGADPNMADSDDYTPLHWAAYNNDCQTAILLLKAGAQLDRINNDGMTPLELAIASDSNEVVMLIENWD